MTAPETAAGASWRGTRVLVGLSRAQERRLRSLWLDELGLQVMARCGSAPQLLEAAGRGEADVALVDEDLHRFDSAHRAAAWQAGTPLVALVRDRDDPRWRDVPGLVLPLEAELPAVLDALGRAAGGERHVQTPKPSDKAQASSSPISTPIRARRVAEGPSRIQVLAFWGGRGHGGSMLLATSCAAILGSAAPTVLVDLDVSGAAVGVQLEDGHQGRVRSSLGDLVSADLDSLEAWQRELERTLQPLGTYAEQAQVLCGLQRRRQRVHVSTALVERLVAELRMRFAFVVLDVGADSPADSQVTAAAHRPAPGRRRDRAADREPGARGHSHRAACLTRRPAGCVRAGLAHQAPAAGPDGPGRSWVRRVARTSERPLGCSTAVVAPAHRSGACRAGIARWRQPMTTVAVQPLDNTDETDRAVLRELRQRIADAVARLNDGQAVIDEATLRETIHEQVQAYQRWARQENGPRLNDSYGGGEPVWRR